MEVPPIALDRGSDASLAVQLADALRRHTTAGLFRTGERLPSTRALAGALGVSRSVCAAGYEQLLAEGWVTGRRGAGTYVIGPPAPAVPTGAPPVAASQARRLPISLAAGRPCLDVVDRAAWRRAWRAGADDAPGADTDPAGWRPFRAAIAEHLLRHRGLSRDADSVLGSTGSTAGIAEIARTLPPGSLVAVEDPGYQRAVQVFGSAGHRVVPVRVDGDGLDVGAIPPNAAAVYCTPAHQFPLGARMSASRRVALVERARAESFWVIEDDFDGELRYDVAPLPVLASLGPDVVAHLGTASKILTPTLGVGWIVAPPRLHEALLAARVQSVGRASEAGQRVFTAYLTAGDLARHLRRLRRELATRRAEVIAALTEAGATAQGDEAGAHLVVPLPDPATEAAVRAAAARVGLELDGLARHRHGPAGCSGLVLGYAGPTRGELSNAVRLLTSVLTRVQTGR